MQSALAGLFSHGVISQHQESAAGLMLQIGVVGTPRQLRQNLAKVILCGIERLPALLLHARFLMTALRFQAECEDEKPLRGARMFLHHLPRPALPFLRLAEPKGDPRPLHKCGGVIRRPL